MIEIPITSENYIRLGIIYNREKLKRGEYDRYRRWRIWWAILYLNAFPFYYEDQKPQIAKDIAYWADANLNTVVSLLNYYCRTGRCEKQKIKNGKRGRPRTGYIVSRKVIEMFYKKCFVEVNRNGKIEHDFHPELFRPTVLFTPRMIVKALKKYSKEELIRILQED